MKMMLTWRLALVVAAVCVSSVCSSGQADFMSKLLMPQDYGIKLCGREFIRAVIFTCGGSRWRRSSEQEFETLQWTNDPTEEDHLRGSADVQALADSHSLSLTSPFSLADLLVVYGAVGDTQPELQQVLSETTYLEKPQYARLSGEEAVSSLADNWPVSYKKKRSFSRGVAGICCSQGCTKNDIGRLC